MGVKQRECPPRVFKSALQKDTQQTKERAMAAKQLQLSTSIQSSFGKPDDPDYVFDIVVNNDKSFMAVSLSTNAIKLYDPGTGAFKGDLLGHSDTISGLNFPDRSSPTVLFSSSADSTVRLWDLRVKTKPAIVFRAHKPSDEIWSFSVGGSTGRQIAGGGDAKVFIWDFTSKKLVTVLDEIHSEAVTRVQYNPVKKEQLVTASVDGQINVLDMKGPPDNEDNLVSSINLGTSLSSFGFYGKENEKLWVLTHIETLMICSLEDEKEVANFGDTRTKASYSWSLPSVTYLINCHSLKGTDSLWLAAGNDDGSVGYFPVDYTRSSNNSSVPVISDAAAVLEGGHQGVVRTIWMNEDQDLQQPVFCWTGGEDGRLCCWTKNGSTERGQAWVSSNLVIRKASSGSKHRARPY